MVRCIHCGFETENYYKHHSEDSIILYFCCKECILPYGLLLIENNYDPFGFYNSGFEDRCYYQALRHLKKIKSRASIRQH